MKLKINGRLGGLITVIIIIITVIIYNNPLANDYFQVVFYSGPQSIKDLSTQSGMNDHGKALFYSTSPELVDYTTLLKYCPTSNTNAQEFGCYVPTNNKIYILSISDSRLASMMAVTAAHEMLHKAYSSLISPDLTYADDGLNAFVAAIKSSPDSQQNKDLTDMMKPYVDEGASQDTIENELHSLIGTELYVTNQNLLSHYNYYFISQSAPVNKYKAQQASIATIETELTNTRTGIDDFKTSIIDRDSNNQASIQNQLNYDSYSGNVYNYNLNVNIWNSNIPIIQSNIDRYNSMVDSYNKKLLDYQSIFKDFKTIQTAPNTKIK